ncbi:MAG: SOS response-associated peptidase [Betaproteobacteria bacterium]
MCGRYELHTHPAAIALAFGIGSLPSLGARYNIAPMQDVPVVRRSQAGPRELVNMRWGLVPRWAKDPSIGSKMINARSETIAEKPSFRTAFRRHRCLLPADGFYEWKLNASGGKQPIHIGMKDGGMFAFAGLAERWLSPEGEVLDTCTIVTTQANALLSPLHDRMPVIVAANDYERWLDVTTTEVSDLFAPYPATAMMWYPVSTRVNSVRNDDAALVERIDDESVTTVEAALDPEAPPVAKPEQSRLF